MSLLLDTCVISELVKPRPDAKVVHWIRERPEDQLYLSVITLGEIQKGIVRLAPSKRRRDLQSWLDHDLPTRFRGRIWPISVDIAGLWGKIAGESESRGRRMAVLDGLIAATAMAYEAKVVTRNTKDFEPSGVGILDPWGTG